MEIEVGQRMSELMDSTTTAFFRAALPDVYASTIRDISGFARSVGQ
jgi:hypothetical protein